MNIFIFHRDLRLNDNTTLIKQLQKYKTVTPIFIFPPEQINPKTNDYFSNNSVQFMIESLHELSNEIKDKHGKLYFFKGPTMSVIKQIHKTTPIQSIAFNFDYTPYALQRDEEIRNWCKKNNLDCIVHEDYVLHDILGNETKKSDGEPYQVFTPFREHCQKTLKIRTPDKFRSFQFTLFTSASNISYNMNEFDITKFYKPNPNINVHGGRKNGLKILSSIEKFKDYDKKRDFLTYKTTFLSAHNHFSTVSIREVYYAFERKFGKHHGIINELYWRDFYVNVTYFFPDILQGQIHGKNQAFRKKYNKITWSNNVKHFEKWCKGETGFPIIDAAQNQLNTTGYMHNRCRMCSAMFLTKDLHISWRDGEKYFAKHLVDYSPMQNNGGWQWASSTGTDAQPYFRIFNPWTQIRNYDEKCEYIKTWIPSLKDVPINDILNWNKPEIHEKWLKNGIKYYAPMIVHEEETKKTLSYFGRL
jgi:deoxyribodipyrimidine photo-lyase